MTNPNNTTSLIDPETLTPPPETPPPETPNDTPEPDKTLTQWTKNAPPAARWTALALTTILIFLAGGVLLNSNQPAAPAADQPKAPADEETHPWDPLIPRDLPHTPEGAKEAAIRYVAMLGSPLINDPERHINALLQSAAPQKFAAWQATGRELLQKWDEIVQELEIEDPLLMYYPLATHMSSYHDGAATVRVWTMVLVAGKGTPARVTWSTHTVSIFREGDQWLAGEVRATHADPTTTPVPGTELMDFTPIFQGTED